ncbi:hypothetical protein ACS0TY_008813 [Phlomoides rotata]
MTISQAGKLTLLKSVTQSITTYLMSCFRIPSGIIDSIESSMCRVWGDPWVRTRENLILDPFASQLDVDLKVRDLFSQDYITWDAEVVSSLFYTEDYEAILALPLRRLNKEDYLAWKGERNGLYSVKSGYFLWKDELDRNSDSPALEVSIY